MLRIVYKGYYDYEYTITIRSLSGFANNDSSPISLAPGRFGQPWRKRQRCWSNFAHPQLAGMASSPGHEVVWRTMDRARIVGFVDLQNNDNDDGGNEMDPPNDTTAIQNMHFVLEFRADGSVVGQIPRVISALSLSGVANNDSSTIRLAPRRFGQLWRRVSR